eukprot:2177906-Karenia_brevis.AAC.1
MSSGTKSSSESMAKRILLAVPDCMSFSMADGVSLLPVTALWHQAIAATRWRELSCRHEVSW